MCIRDRGNRVPLLAATGVTMTDRAAVGKTGDHMRFVATDGISSVPAIMFRVPDIDRCVACDAVVDLVFEAVAERWQGRVKPKLMVKDILRHDAAGSKDDMNDNAPIMASAVVADEAFGDAPDASRRSMLARLPYDELTRTLIHSFIGCADPHPAQRDALDALGQGKSVLAVMGTGRGKSLIFQVHAAREALSHDRASIFVYPLRALVADQSFHLVERFSQLGLHRCV